ncbi:MAG: hypothetical protein AAF975_05950, partial [Spirochaetota bacterium]
YGGEPFFSRISRGILTSVGPLIYLVLSIIPWLGPENFSLLEVSFPQLSLPEFSRMVKLPQFFVRGETLRVGTLELHTNSEDQPVGLDFGDFSLSWSAQRPLRLLMADGSQKEILPLAYRQRDDGFALPITPDLELRLRLIEGKSGPKGQLASAPELPLQVELVSEGPFSPDLSAMSLPWNVESPAKVQGEAGHRIGVGQNSYFAGVDELQVSADAYIEVPLQYYTFLDPSGTAGEAAPSRTMILLREQSPGSKYSLYQELRSSYESYLLRRMRAKAKSQEVPAADWVALYLELLLRDAGNSAENSAAESAAGEQTLAEERGRYEQARLRMREIVEANNWSSRNLIPYLGIEQTALEEFIRIDYERINSMRNGSYLSGWSFNGQMDLAELMFNYGYFRALLGVMRYAVDVRNTGTLSEDEQFYLLGFLWRATLVYPRNGLLFPQNIQEEFRVLLRDIAESWAGGFPQGLSISYALDVLKVLQEDELGLRQYARSISIQLFRLLDSAGSLPAIYGSEGERLPCYRSWPALVGSSPYQPRSITVVPGFWLWTAGSASVFYESGKPIEINADNFIQGSKLLLLRGVYFYPREVLVDGIESQAVGQIPLPQLGKSPTWYYDSGNKILAIDMPAGNQDKTSLLIR